MKLILMLAFSLFSAFVYSAEYKHTITSEDMFKSGAAFRVPSIWYINTNAEVAYYGMGSDIAISMKELVLNGMDDKRNIGPINGQGELTKINSVIESNLTTFSGKDVKGAIVSLIVEDPSMPCPPCDSHKEQMLNLIENFSNTDIHHIVITK